MCVCSILYMLPWSLVTIQSIVYPFKVITEQSHWLQMLLRHLEQPRFFMKALLCRSVW